MNVLYKIWKLSPPFFDLNVMKFSWHVLLNVFLGVFWLNLEFFLWTFFCWIHLFGIYLVIIYFSLLAITRICPLVSILQRTIVRTKYRSMNIHNLHSYLVLSLFLNASWWFEMKFYNPFHPPIKILKVFIKLTFFWMICNYVSIVGSVG